MDDEFITYSWILLSIILHVVYIPILYVFNVLTKIPTNDVYRNSKKSIILPFFLIEYLIIMTCIHLLCLKDLFDEKYLFFSMLSYYMGTYIKFVV